MIIEVNNVKYTVLASTNLYGNLSNDTYKKELMLKRVNGRKIYQGFQKFNGEIEVEKESYFI